MSDEVVKNMVEILIEKAEEATRDDVDSFGSGRRLAFVEMLSSLKGSLIAIDPEAPAKYGLEFDVYERFA